MPIPSRMAYPAPDTVETPGIDTLREIFLRMVQFPLLGEFTIRQSCMLWLIYQERQTIHSLKQIMQVDKPALVRGADKLQALGLIDRTENPSDKRSVYMVITTQGKREVEKFAGL